MQNELLSGRYYLPSDALARRRVESTLALKLESRGYQEILLPVLVGMGLGNLDGDPEYQRTSYAVLTREGNLMTLRSDFTMPVAALAARHLLPSEEPVRLYYSGSVFRAQKPGSGKQEEWRQVGAELIGTASTRDADVELLAMAAEGLLSLGLRDFCIGLSDAGLLSAILDAAGASGEGRRIIWEALAARDYVAYGQLVQDLGTAGGAAADATADTASARRLLGSLPGKVGGVEVLSDLEGAGLASAAAGLASALKALADRGLETYFKLDLGIAREFQYYTGIVFEGYAVGSADAVIGGGRYDGLLERFGRSAPAAGFAIDVDSVVAAASMVSNSTNKEASL